MNAIDTNILGYLFDPDPPDSLSHWDSLLVAACQEAHVTCLYSEDMQHGADYDGVRIINPFARQQGLVNRVLGKFSLICQSVQRLLSAFAIFACLDACRLPNF